MVVHVLAEQVWSVWLWLYDRLTHKLDFYNTRLPDMLLLNAIKPLLWLLDSCNGLVLVEILLFMFRTVSSNFKWRFIRLISSVPLHGIYCMIFLLALFPPFSSTHLLFSVAFQLLFILDLLTTNNFSPVTCFNEYLQAEMTLKQLENLSPPIMKQVLPLVEQLPPLYMDLVKGREEFTPKPEETRRLVC